MAAPEIFIGAIARGSGDGSAPVGSRGEAPVGGMGTSPQKLKQFADIVYRF